MMRGFYNGVSGVKTQSFGMDVWANNVANINNVGFKASLPEFKSIFYQSVVQAGNKPTTDQVGLGATKQTTALDFTTGSFQNTDNTFDLAINGEGFFGVLGRDGKTYYTRTGSFDIDAAGNLVNNQGNFLLGTINSVTPVTPSASALKKFGRTVSGTTPQAYTLAQTGAITLASEGAQTKITLPKFLYLPAEATTKVNFKGNLDSTRKIERQEVALEDTSYTYAVDNVNKTISLRGSVTLSTSASGFKKGDTVTVKVSDGTGKFSEFNTTLDENGAWRLDDQAIRYLDLASLNVSARATSSTEVANAKKMSAELYNADGTKSLLTLNLTKQIPQPASQTIWNASATITDADGNVLNSALGQLTFDSSGRLASNTLSSVGGVELNFGGSGDPLVYDGMTSAANSDKNIAITKNGYPEGSLKTYQMDDAGNIQAIFDNTRMYPIAKVALYHFQNDQGVAKIGDNLYEATANSGKAFFYKNARGEVFYNSQIKSNRLEMSNVDLAQALTEIIVVQKAYDASSKSITTSDQMVQTAIQMKR
jgi:fagellar hook-basal body proteins